MPPLPYFDAHCDTVSLCRRDGRALRRNGGHLDLARLGGFSRAAQVFALYADSDIVPPGGLFRECEAQRQIFLSELWKNRDVVSFCPGGRGVRSANDCGRIAALLSIEGGELLDCDPARLALASRWGVRCINLTWNHANLLSGSHREQPDQGLTDLGRAWVAESNRLHILPDVSHLSDRGFWDVAKLTTQPILATHSNARSICGHSRNLTDDMFRAICESDGAAGVNFWWDFVGAERSMDEIVRHVEHFLSLGGEKHLALGGDWDGCDGLSGGMTGVQDVPMLWQALSDRGYDDALLEDLFYNNLLRVLS